MSLGDSLAVHMLSFCPPMDCSSSAGVNESPLMTWGEVENTPLRVEGSETPYMDRTPGPAFKVSRSEGSTGGTLSGCVVS